jgi:hypothetical protein
MGEKILMFWLKINCQRVSIAFTSVPGTDEDLKTLLK